MQDAIRLISSRTQGIAFVRPVPQISGVDMAAHLRSVWIGQQPPVGLVVGNGCEDGVVPTMNGIIGRGVTSATVTDLVALPEDDLVAHANRLLGVAKKRLTVMLSGEPKNKRLNIVVALLDNRGVLDEILLRYIVVYGAFSTELYQTMKRCLARPGDGVVVNWSGRFTDRPIIPRHLPSLVTTEPICG